MGGMGIKELLTNQLKETSMRKLAEKCNVSQSTISDILHDKRPASREFCLALANGLGLEYSYILQLAGYGADEQSMQSARDRQVDRELRGLNDHEVEAVRQFAKMLREQRRSYKSDK
jgi:transcriptional regulator with XRE-family HTH domain